MSKLEKAELMAFLGRNPHLVDRYTVHPDAFQFSHLTEPTAPALEIVTKDLGENALTLLAIGLQLSTHIKLS